MLNFDIHSFSNLSTDRCRWRYVVREFFIVKQYQKYTDNRALRLVTTLSDARDNQIILNFFFEVNP